MPTDKLSPDSTVRRSENSLFTELDDALVLMSIDKGNYYSLDTIGADVWQRLDGKTPVAALCAALCAEYDADAETIRRDVLTLLERLVEEGLVETCS